jgi:trypsin
LPLEKIAVLVGEASMKVSCASCGLFVVLAAACGSSRSFDERTAVTTQAIQDGTADTSDKYAFAVAVVSNGQQVGLCSGALLAPNLVATARHCVTALTGPKEIDCATSTFGADLPVAQLLVTNAATLSSGTRFFAVRQIIVPTGAQQTKVCGNDIALLILDQNVTLPQYVTPTLNPPMSDPRYSISVTAIGYGIDSPLDTTGMSAGTRRVRENVELMCVPNDTSFFGCYSGADVSQVLSPDEFVSGDASTCEGDSGSGAYDQGSFDRGEWVSFGVLSRGGTDVDSGTCVQPIYSRFDAWAPLLVQGATQAAALGAYAVPSWANLTGGGSDASTEDSAVAQSSTGAPGVVLADGAVCGQDSECQSKNCVSTDDQHFVCASACAAGACSAGFGCDKGFCFPSEAAPSPGAKAHSGGCSMAAASPRETLVPWSKLGALIVGFLLLVRRPWSRVTRLPLGPRMRSTRTHR